MLEINCPWCGPRDQIEFSCGGEAHIGRPLEPENLSDDDWADYLFYRKNPEGRHHEQWCHTAGCRKWFNAIRNTVTYQFETVYRIGEDLPEKTSR